MAIAAFLFIADKRHEISGLKKAVQKTGMTVIHITHNMNDAWMLANKTAVMKSGRLVQFGGLMDVLCRPGSEFVARFVGVNLFNAQIEPCSNGACVASVADTRLTCRETAAQPHEAVIPRDWNVVKASILSIMDNGSLFRLALQLKDFKAEAVVTRHIISFFAHSIKTVPCPIIGQEIMVNPAEK